MRASAPPESFDVKVNAAETRHADRARREPQPADHRQALPRRPRGHQQGRDAGAADRDKGSAGYVALERVTGKLKGSSGSFVLQHSATMKRGDAGRQITVVPDSATGELRGLSGKMNISVAADGAHAYEFDFRLEARRVGLRRGRLRRRARVPAWHRRARRASCGSPLPRPGSSRDAVELAVAERQRSRRAPPRCRRAAPGRCRRCPRCSAVSSSQPSRRAGHAAAAMRRHDRQQVEVRGGRPRSA